jgi:hypothetical protein
MRSVERKYRGVNSEMHAASIFGVVNQRQSYFTTGDLPPISSSWRQAL